MLGLRERIAWGLVAVLLAFIYFTRAPIDIESETTTRDTIRTRTPVHLSVVTSGLDFVSSSIVEGEIIQIERHTVVVDSSRAGSLERDTLYVSSDAQKLSRTFTIPDDLGEVKLTMFVKGELQGVIPSFELYKTETHINETTVQRVFKPRLMLGAYLTFDHLTPEGWNKPANYGVSGGGLELLYVRKMVYYKAAYGITTNEYGAEGLRHRFTDAQFTAGFGFNIFNKR